MAGAGAVVARILTQYSDKGTKAAQKDIARLEKKINAFGKRAVQSFAVASAASAAFAVKIGVDAVKAAIEDSKSQEALALTLRNVTGATDGTIKSVEDYISKQQMLSNVSDTELRASLSQLVTVTGDVTAAMDLQSVALDAAAGSGNDLASVTAAIAKAQAGNFTSLKKMFPALDASIIKNKQLGKALLTLDKTYKGASKELAKKDPIKGLSIVFGELSEQLGYALLPAVIEFAEYVKSDVIPLIEAWISKNEDGLNETLKNSVGKIQEVVKAFQDIYKVLGGINAILPFGIGGWLKLAAAVTAFSTASGLALEIIKRYKALKTMAGLARGSTETFKALRTEMSLLRSIGVKVFQVFGSIGAWAARSTGVIALITRGFILLGRAIMFTPWGRIATLVVALGYGLKKLADHFGWFGQGQKKLSASAQAVEDSIQKASKSYTSMDQAVAKYNASKETTNKLTAEEIARNKRLAAMNAKSAAQAKADAAKAAAIAKGQAALAKMGYKTTEDDPIQLEAARLNLVKQGNLAEAARVAAMSKNLELQLEANKALARYNDLLAVLADKEITSNEVLILSKKWGMTVEATQSYIQTLIAVADQTISDEEITNLAKAWGVSKEQASRYLDFFTALNDGKLSDAEINKLQTKWGLTSKEVGIYQDLITKASDYVLSDAEINDLKKNWGLTTDEVIAYIKKLGQPVTFSGTLIDPATQATLGWKSALAALEAYQKALAGGGYKSSGTTTTTPSTTTPSTTVVPTVPNVGNIDAVTAAVKTQTETFLDEIKNNQTLTKTASEIANEMAASLLADEASKAALGGTTGVLSSARYTGQALQYYAQQEAERQRAAALQSLKESEAAAKATRIDQMERDYSPTIDNAGYIASNSAYGSPNITINVAGSVTTEGDLIANIRNGLLNTQYNGNSLLLSAAAI